jgi:hypothetical protein
VLRLRLHRLSSVRPVLITGAVEWRRKSVVRRLASVILTFPSVAGHRLRGCPCHLGQCLAAHWLLLQHNHSTSSNCKRSGCCQNRGFQVASGYSLFFLVVRRKMSSNGAVSFVRVWTQHSLRLQGTAFPFSPRSGLDCCPKFTCGNACSSRNEHHLQMQRCRRDQSTSQVRSWSGTTKVGSPLGSAGGLDFLMYLELSISNGAPLYRGLLVTNTASRGIQ